MSKFKPYLEYLENADQIKSLAREIINLELELDELEETKSQSDDIITDLNREMQEMDGKLKNENDSQKINDLKEKIGRKKHEVSRQMAESRPIINEINKKEIELFRLQESRKEAIRRGMANLFHQAKEEYEEARLDWIKYSEISLNAHEKLKKKKKEMDAIKHAFKAEFGDDE